MSGARGGGISGLAVAMAGLGVYLVYAGIRNVPFVDGLRELATGRVPTPRPATPTAVSFNTGAAGSAAGAVVGGAVGGSGKYDLGPVKAHVRAAAEELGPRFGIKTIGGWRVQADGDHPRGLALDFMTRTGQALADFLVANHARYKISYVIWNRRIWNQARAGEGWRTYTGTSNPHTDHVHASFLP
jgi:hypothetical protein